MKAALTGGTGYVGSALAKALVAAGFAVRALHRSSSDRSPLDNLEIEWLECDVEDENSLKGVFKGCEVLFHVAGIFSYWDADGLEEKFLSGTRNVLEAAAKQGVKRVVLTSSSVALGASRRPRVLTESMHAPLPDDTVYVLAKRKQEELAFKVGVQLGLDVRAVCPGLVIGGRDTRFSEGSRMLVSYLKDPWKSTWPGGCNLVHVDDVARAHLIVLEKGTAGQRYLACSENLEWFEVHTLISELAGMPGPYLTGNHTIAYLAALVQEFKAKVQCGHPDITREQAKMVGNYYWYSSALLETLGFQPMGARETVVSALAWLLHSPWIPGETRSEMRLSKEVRAYKAKYGYAF